MKLLMLILKNVGRSPLRSILTALGTMMLVFVVTMVWSVLWLLDLVTAEKKENLKGIITERWSVPSRLPFSYAGTLAEGAARNPDGAARALPYNGTNVRCHCGRADLHSRICRRTARQENHS